MGEDHSVIFHFIIYVIIILFIIQYITVYYSIISSSIYTDIAQASDPFGMMLACAVGKTTTICLLYYYTV